MLREPTKQEEHFNLLTVGDHVRLVKRPRVPEGLLVPLGGWHGHNGGEDGREER